MPKTSRNLLHVIGGEFLLRLANVAVAVLIGRVYGPALLGVYAAIVAVATLVERFADNGLEMAGIAVASRRPENLGRIGTALYVNKTVLSLIAIAALAGIAWATGFLRDHLLIACILTLRTFLYSYCRLNAGLLKSVGRSPYISRIQIVHFLILSGAILFLARKRSGFSSVEPIDRSVRGIYPRRFSTAQLRLQLRARFPRILLESRKPFHTHRPHLHLIHSHAASRRPDTFSGGHGCGSWRFRRGERGARRGLRRRVAVQWRSPCGSRTARWECHRLQRALP